MKQLPFRSNASFVTGIWVVQEHENAIMRLWMSTVTGKEVFYIGEEEKASLYNISTAASFMSYKDKTHAYEVEIHTESLMHYIFTISFFVDGKLEGTFKTKTDINTGNIEVVPNEDTASVRTRMHERFLHEGIVQLRSYDLLDAEASFKKALQIKPKSAEVFFHLACIASLNEEVNRSFAHLNKAIEYNLKGRDRLKYEDALAYIRVLPEFDDLIKPLDSKKE